jgi:hypothetical protein
MAAAYLRQIPNAFLSMLTDPNGTGVKNGLVKPLEHLYSLSDHFNFAHCIPSSLFIAGKAMGAVKAGIVGLEVFHSALLTKGARPERRRAYVIVTENTPAATPGATTGTATEAATAGALVPAAAGPVRLIAQIPNAPLTLIMKKWMAYTGFVYNLTDSISYFKHIGAIGLSSGQSEFGGLLQCVSGGATSVLGIAEEALFLLNVWNRPEHNVELLENPAPGQLVRGTRLGVPGRIATGELVISGCKIVTNLFGIGLSALFLPRVWKGDLKGSRLLVSALFTASTVVRRLIEEMTVKRRDLTQANGTLPRTLWNLQTS